MLAFLLSLPQSTTVWMPSLKPLPPARQTWCCSRRSISRVVAPTISISYTTLPRRWGGALSHGSSPGSVALSPTHSGHRGGTLDGCGLVRVLLVAIHWCSTRSSALHSHLP